MVFPLLVFGQCFPTCFMLFWYCFIGSCAMRVNRFLLMKSLIILLYSCYCIMTMVFLLSARVVINLCSGIFFLIQSNITNTVESFEVNKWITSGNRLTSNFASNWENWWQKHCRFLRHTWQAKYIPVHVWEESTWPRTVLKTCTANSLQYHGTMTMEDRCKRFCTLIIVRQLRRLQGEIKFQLVADTPSSVRIWKCTGSANKLYQEWWYRSNMVSAWG
jgi:hypothetical protein